MTDIQMKNNCLPMYNNDFILIENIDRIKQQIIIALNTFYSDWLPDYTKGIDYAYGFRHEECLEHDIKKQIIGVSGVLSIKSFNLEYDKSSMKINVIADITTQYGKLDIKEVINQ